MGREWRADRIGFAVRNGPKVAVGAMGRLKLSKVVSDRQYGAPYSSKWFPVATLLLVPRAGDSRRVWREGTGLVSEG